MDALYMGCLIAWQCGDFIAHLYLSCLYLALESTEGVVRTADSLYRHVKALFLVLILYVNTLKV